MSQYSITSVSRITGLSPSTIRTWERRYGVPVASRAANGRRFYTDDEVERLKLIAALVRDGRPISDLTALSVDQLRASERPDTASSAVSAAHRDLINALETADLDSLRWGVSQAFLRLSVLDAVEKVVSPMLKLLGLGWQEGHFTPGLEHAAAAVTKQSIYAAAAMHGGSPSGKPVLFTTLTGERHELGLLLGWLLALTENANAIHLGTELPPDLIAEAAHLFGADLIVLSFVRDANAQTLGRALRALDKALPPHIEVWLCADESHPAHSLKSGGRFTPISAYGEFHRRIRLHAGA